MRIKNTPKETSFSLVKQAKARLLKGFDPKAASSEESVELLEEYNKELVEIVERGTMIAKLKVLSNEERKKKLIELKTDLAKIFALQVDKKLYAVLDAFLPQHKAYLYQLMEFIKDLDICFDEDAERQWHQTFRFYKSKKEVAFKEYIAFYGSKVLHIDTLQGTIHKRTEVKQDLEENEHLNNTEISSILEDVENILKSFT